MKYIESLDVWNGNEVSLFLGGGITGCENWRDKIIHLLSTEPVTLLNPRRKNFLIDDPSSTEELIRWEFIYLEKSSAVMFWFPSETLCPITLFELGTFARCSKKIFVGCHPEYKRRVDIITQMSLYRTDVKVVDTLEEIALQIKTFLAGQHNLSFEEKQSNFLANP